MTSSGLSAELLTSLFGVASTLVGVVLAYYFARESMGAGDSLEARIARLSRALKESSGLISEMESEIKSRENLAIKLAKDAKSYEQLISLNRAQVEAVSSALRREVVAESKRAFWKNFVQNVGFFVAGALVTFVSATMLQ